MPKGVELQAADAMRAAEPGPVELPAPQDRPDAPDQLGHREGLRDVVVGPDLEPEHAVELRPFPRQHQVEDDQIDPVLARSGQSRVPVRAQLDLEALLAQRVAERVPERRLVVDDEDLRHRDRFAPSGSEIVTVVPWPGPSEVTCSSPFIVSRAACTIARPSPNPSLDSSPRKKRSATRGSASGEMPIPVSTTRTSARPSRRSASNWIDPASVYFAALRATFMINCSRSSRFAI